MKNLLFISSVVFLSSQLMTSAIALPPEGSGGLNAAASRALRPIQPADAVELIELGKDEIEAIQAPFPFLAEAENIDPQELIPVVPYEYSFKWQLSSHQFSIHYIRQMDDVFFDQTPHFARQIGNIEYLYIISLAMDEPAVIRQLSGDQMSVLADTAITKYLIEQEAPRAENFLVENQKRRAARAGLLQVGEHVLEPEALISRKHVKGFASEVREQIFEKWERKKNPNKKRSFLRKTLPHSR